MEEGTLGLGLEGQIGSLSMETGVHEEDLSRGDMVQEGQPEAGRQLKGSLPVYARPGQGSRVKEQRRPSLAFLLGPLRLDQTASGGQLHLGRTVKTSSAQSF